MLPLPRTSAADAARPSSACPHPRPPLRESLACVCPISEDHIHPSPFFFWFAVLDRLDAFLPSLRTANTELAERAAADPLSVNVEHVENEEEEHVEMVRLLC